MTDGNPTMADTFGVPTFYATHCVRESAGYGNIRIWNCTMRDGILIPSSEVIFPASQIILVCHDIVSYAQEVFNFDQMTVTGVAPH